MYSVTPRSKLGYFNIRSALQKAIRRCQLDDVLYCVAELDLTGLGNSVFVNLLLITSEDVGLANPKLTSHVNRCYQNWLSIVKKNKIKKSQSHTCNEARLELIKAAYAVATSPKSRVVDYVHHMMEFWGHDKNHQLEEFIAGLGDRDLKKTILALNMLIGTIYGVHKSKPQYYCLIWDILEKQAQTDSIKQIIKDLRRSFNWISEKIVTFNLIFGCLLVTQNDYQIKDVIIPSEHDLIKETAKLYNADYQRFVMHDYVYDCHTSKGRKLGRGQQHFYDVASLVTNLGYPELYKDIVKQAEILEEQGVSHKEIRKILKLEKNNVDGIQKHKIPIKEKETEKIAIKHKEKIPIKHKDIIPIE